MGDTRNWKFNVSHNCLFSYRNMLFANKRWVQSQIRFGDKKKNEMLLKKLQIIIQEIKSILIIWLRCLPVENYRIIKLKKILWRKIKTENKRMPIEGPVECCIRPYSYFRCWTGSSLKLRLMRAVFANANSMNRFLFVFPQMSLHSLLVQ